MLRRRRTARGTSVSNGPSSIDSGPWAALRAFCREAAATLRPAASLIAAAALVGCDATSASLPGPSGSTSPEVALLLAPYRPDDTDSDELFRFEPGQDIESFDGELVRVHFTRAGPDAVKLADADGNEVPDSVELVAATYDEVLAFFDGHGFHAP